MGKSYPSKYTSSGIWKVTDIADNLQKYGTWPNAAGRGIFAGGEAPGYSDIIDYITLPSTGDAADFGDLITANSYRNNGNGSSVSRAMLAGGGGNPAKAKYVDKVTFSTTGDGADWGDLVTERFDFAGTTNGVKGFFGGGYDGRVDVIETATIATDGTSADFGDLLAANYGVTGANSQTRGIFAGGNVANGSPYRVNVIQYITFSTAGNAVDFGNLTQTAQGKGGCSNNRTALFAGGNNPTKTATTDYITIASTGDAGDFGDLNGTATGGAMISNFTRGVHGGGATPSLSDVLDYFNFATAGNATDFGDLTARSGVGCACSSGGGLESFDPSIRFAPTPGVW
tara:strand:- start:62 stop:1087 length:1026 start_codon:yes stop_codon:yes gene_type:complete